MATIKSLEEKAKRYDEAIKRAKELLEVGLKDTRDKRVVLSFFPELAESEDEKIKQELIEYHKIQAFLDGKPNNKHVKFVAWLEKQGEQKSVPTWMPTFLDELRSKKNYFDWDEHKDIEGKILAIIRWMNPNYFNGKDGEQKPTSWSEEDEKLYNDLSDTYFYNDEDYPEETYELMLKRVLDWMTKRAKFLRPQSTWKPSEGQMELLREVQQALLGKDCHNRFVDFVYELKRLREE